MPIYEYRCQDCGKKSTFITLSVKSQFEVRCKRCKSRNLEKIISPVAVFRSEESRMESLADPSRMAGLDEKDPESVARWMKKMGKEMGEDLGDDLDQLAEEAAEEGEKIDESQDEGEI